MANLLKAQEASERLGVPESTLAQWRYRRVGPPFVKVGAGVRYDVDDLDDYVRRQTVTTHAGGAA